MYTLLQKIQKFVQSLLHPQPVRETTTLPVCLVRLQKLAQMLINTQELELTCQEAYDVIDQYIELILQGKDAGTLMPLVQHHLKLCADCQEEYELLLTMLRSSS